MNELRYYSNTMQVRPVILSGGAGTRLWPLSRATYPKQLMPLLSEESLLQATARRVAPSHGFLPPLIVCNAEHRFMVAEQLRSIEVAPEAILLEVSPQQEAFGAALGARVARDGGAALLIDYGRAEPGFGDTLQALKRHEKVDPLACPGEADLTVHADFPLVLGAARAAGAHVTDALPQGLLLLRLGMAVRAEALKAANPPRAETIERQFQRLAAPEHMGELFRAAAIHQPGLVPPGFETQA